MIDIIDRAHYAADLTIELHCAFWKLTTAMMFAQLAGMMAMPRYGNVVRFRVIR